MYVYACIYVCVWDCMGVFTCVYCGCVWSLTLSVAVSVCACVCACVCVCARAFVICVNQKQTPEFPPCNRGNSSHREQPCFPLIAQTMQKCPLDTSLGYRRGRPLYEVITVLKVCCPSCVGSGRRPTK